ncbi:MAG: hypothetical protein J5J06_00545 [Phycisphaerae bacterium]|nr:hypothetical protein [Phycisphaerae bacterium]
MPTQVEVLQRNLAALSERQADVAERIAVAEPPSGVEAAMGRDGCPTFRLSGSGNRPWLGFSSMPSVSAEALVSGVAVGSDNLLLPTVLAGWEIALLLNRMPLFTVLFVIETQAWAANLVLRLHDFSAFLHDGRLLLFPFEDPFPPLVEFLDRNPGYEPPGRLIAVPQLSTVLLGEMERRLIQSVATVQAKRQDAIQDIRNRWHVRDEASQPEPRIAVVSTSPAAPTIAWARAVGEGLRREGIVHNVCVPDRPEHVHVAARLGAAQRCGANLVLSVDALPGRLGPPMPESVSSISWLITNNVPSQDIGDPPTLDRQFLAASTSIAVKLVERGANEQFVSILEPGLPETWLADLDETGGAGHPGSPLVAILADVADDRAAALGINQHSHVQLWETVRSLCLRTAMESGDASPDNILAAASRSIGVPVHDPEFESHLISWIEGRAMPAAVARATADLLLRARIPLALWGLRWDLESRHRSSWRGAIPWAGGFGELVRCSTVIVFPVLDAELIPVLLLALAGKRGVVVRRPSRVFRDEFPALAELEPALNMVDSAEEVAARTQWLSALGQSSTSQDAERERWSRSVRDRHLLSHRLAAMLSRIHSARPLTGTG